MDQVARTVFLLEIGFDVPFLFLLKDLVDRDQDTGFFYFAKLMIDSGSENADVSLSKSDTTAICNTGESTV